MGFNVDGIGRGLVMNEGDVDVKGDAEHHATCAPEVSVGPACAVEQLLALAFEVQDAGQEDDVLAVELHAGSVHLQAVVAAGETSIERGHRIHLTALGARRFCGQGTGRGGVVDEIKPFLVEGSEPFLVKFGEGAVGLADLFLMLPYLVDGEAQSDNFHRYQARGEPERGNKCQRCDIGMAC